MLLIVRVRGLELDCQLCLSLDACFYWFVMCGVGELTVGFCSVLLSVQVDDF